MSYISGNGTLQLSAQAQKVKKNLPAKTSYTLETEPPPQKNYIVLKTETPNKFFLFHETEMKMFYISGNFLHFMKQLSQLKK